MGGSSTRTNQTQTQNQNQVQNSSGTASTTNTYGQISPLDDPRYAEAVARLAGFDPQSDPRLPYVFGRARQRVEGTFDNPLGGATTQGLRDATLRTAYEDIGQEEAQAYREENFGRQGMKYAQLADVAQLSTPRTVQTGGTTSSSGNSTTTGSGTTTASGTSSNNPGIANTIGQGASLALMAF